ncbi:twin-arginine translocation signal domain-containing protein [Desulfosarcina sp.]|nr:twin-arginine translocation signal domain-containing protein [Desulfosarcina sp.]
MDGKTDDVKSISRRNFMKNTGMIAAAGGIAALGANLTSPATVHAAEKSNKKLSTVPLNWKEVYFTNCPMVSANNIDQELGWCKTDFKKIGVDYSYFRSRRENDWYPHYIHNLDNLIRFGGLYPPIEVHADIRRTRLLGATWVYEGGCMMVRAGDPIFRMKDLKGKKIGLSKSLNKIKNDWWRINEHMGIESMLRLNDMTMKDVKIVEFPYPDDWYSDPKMMEPMINPTDVWGQRNHKHDLAFRPLETALLEGKVDAIYALSKVFQHLQEDTGKIKAIEDLSRYPDWTVQVANTPAVITCTDVMAEKHPELVVTYLKSMIKVGRWANEHKRAAAVILDRQTFYRDAEDTYQGIKHVDMVPNLSPQNLACVEIGKDFMLKHGYIKKDFDVDKWAAPEFLEEAAKQLVEEKWEKIAPEKLSIPGTRLG